MSISTGTARTSDTVNVVFTLTREVKVEHIDVADIKSTGSYISGDKNGVFTFSES